MNKLDFLEKFKKFDEKGVLSSIKMLPQQANQAWEETSNLKFSKDLSGAKNIVVCGMGGSALGGRVVDSFVEKKIRAPIEIFTQYFVPNYVNRDTLVILSSYSGNTEEAMSCAHDAIKRNAKIFGITTGGKLADFLKKEKKDVYIYEPTFNPSKMPRLAIGYSIFAILALLNKSQFITLTEEELKTAIEALSSFVKEFGPRTKQENNLAKRLALRLQNKIPVLVSSEHLIGVSHVFKNQLNETSKTFSNLFDLPELNHHLLEGLKLPAKSKEVLHFLFLYSKLYTDRVVKRYPITQEVVEKNSVSHSLYTFSSNTKLEQIMELLCLGSFASFYLAVLSGTDPSEIPWVDYFKKKLST
jgi:glucose/mannose-6-phosphate isomerase